MQVSDRFRVSESRVIEAHTVDELRAVVLDMATILNGFAQDTMLQLRGKVSVFPVNPTSSVSAVAGALTHDVAAYVENSIAHVKVFDGTVWREV